MNITCFNAKCMWNNWSIKANLGNRPVCLKGDVTLTSTSLVESKNGLAVSSLDDNQLTCIDYVPTRLTQKSVDNPE